MKQYRITTQNLNLPSDNDCILPVDDIYHYYNNLNMWGGLGSGLRNADWEYKQHLARIERMKNENN